MLQAKTLDTLADLKQEQDAVFQEMSAESKHNIHEFEVTIEKEYDRLVQQYKVNDGALEKQRKEHVTDLVFQIHLIKGSMEKYKSLKNTQLSSFKCRLQSEIEEIKTELDMEQKVRITVYRSRPGSPTRSRSPR